MTALEPPVRMSTEPDRDAVSALRLRALAERRFAESIDVPRRFFESHTQLISHACHAMAQRFQRGGRLLVFGEGAEATDAQHVSVEFVHPVIVGKRALPAVALTNDVAALTGGRCEGSYGATFARTLTILGREADIAMGISRDGNSEAVVHALKEARAGGMLTLGLAGGDGGLLGAPDAVDFLFRVPSPDPLVIQEVHETLYHVLWELVHVFFEQPPAG